MANLKSSVKSPDNDRKSGKRNKLSTDVPDPTVMIETRTSELQRFMTKEEKVAHLLQNGHRIRHKFLSQGKSAALKNGEIDKSSLTFIKASLRSKNGKIKTKSGDHLKFFHKILKSELMIPELKNKKPKPALPSLNNNNNYDGISDKNKVSKPSDKKTIVSKPATPEKKKVEMPAVSPKKRCAPASPEKDDKSSPKKAKLSLEKTKLETICPSKNPKSASKKAKKSEDMPLKSRKSKSKNEVLPKNKKGKTADHIKQPKMPKSKQVTLSNGLVLRLSLYQCDYCQKTFTNKSSLRKHIFIHLDIKPYLCHLCNSKFVQRCTLQVHIKKKHANNTPDIFVCNQCDKLFLLEENLLLHLQSHVKNENAFRCVFCDKRFSHHLLLTNHEKQHLVSGQFQCSICKMSYDCRSRLSLHMKSHLNIKDYVCQYCGKEFLRPNSLRRHVSLCHTEFRSQCPICKKKLKGHLPEHMRIHDTKRPHKCPECGQRFVQSTQLTVHRRIHTGARPYPCRICLRAFSHSNALMLHIRRHTGEKPFGCGMCPLSFSQLPHMKSHMMKIHGKTATYKCTKCSEYFQHKSKRDAHEKTCTVGEKSEDDLTFEEKLELAVKPPKEVEVEAVMSLSRMRYLLALLLTMIATKDRMKILGFNKRLIDLLLVDSLVALGSPPCTDMELTPLARLKINIEKLLKETVPKKQMEKFREENKSTEQILVLLTDEKKINYQQIHNLRGHNTTRTSST